MAISFTDSFTGVRKAGRTFSMLVLLGALLSGCTTPNNLAAVEVSESAPPAATVQTTQPLLPGQSPDGFSLRPLVQELDWPLAVLYGPDGLLWVTERAGKRVTRIDPKTGDQQVALTVAEAHQSAGQDGLLGMAFHSELLQSTGHDYVYLAYTYLPTATVTSRATSGTNTRLDAATLAELTKRRVKIRRYTYDPKKETLGNPVDLLTNLPGSNDHNSGRLVFSPDETLFYAIGDQGNNQFDRACLPIVAQELPTAAQVAAQDWSNYPGKVLRLNLDGSIPDDNPTINGVKSHVYSYGHRNLQGLALSADGHLYASEHGPKSDDEVNLIIAGKNYGWPYVAGYQDDQAYVYANWSAADDCPRLQFSDSAIPASVPTQPESDWADPNFIPPLYTFGTVADDYDFQPALCAPLYYICWPTVAPTGVAIYTAASSDNLAWPTSLLVTSLKTGTIFRLALSDDGTKVLGDAIPLVKTTNRYRDLAIDAATGTIYVITDSGNNTQGSFRLPTAALEHRGALLEFRSTSSE